MSITLVSSLNKLACACSLMLVLCFGAEALAAGFSNAAPMVSARAYHTATLLPNGKVLVAGGYSNVTGYLASAELYDPGTNTWSTAGNLSTARTDHTATLLPNGKVLVVGGFNNTLFFLASAELYDPATNAWSAAANIVARRHTHTATLLLSGKVLVAGGSGSSGVVANSELYDPATNTWSAAGSLATARSDHTATLLPNGKVLVAAGWGGGTLYSAELYDPATNNWSPATSLASKRFSATATLLLNDKVLVVGGHEVGTSFLASAELYDPATNAWSTAGSLAIGRADQTATLLPNGKVLVAGGSTSSSGTRASAELYNPTTNAWSAAGNLSTEREGHTSTLLPNGKVLIAGGNVDLVHEVAGNTAELYEPINEAPVITLANSALAYIERSSPKALDASAAVTDVDSPNFGSGTLTVAFSAGPQAEDRLSIEPISPIATVGNTVLSNGTVIGTFEDGKFGWPLVISLNSNATPSATQNLLRAITYSNSAYTPIAAPRTVSVVLTDGDGGTSSAAELTVIVVAVNDAPFMYSNPGATPNPAKVGETISFSVGAADMDDFTLTLTWDFGDGNTFTGTTGNATAPAHAYAVAGSYTVSVTATDGVNPPVTGSVMVTVNSFSPPLAPLDDSDGDGVSNENELADGTDPLNAKSFKSRPMPVSALQINLNYLVRGDDSCTVVGAIPNLPNSFDPNGQVLIINVGGAIVSFTLDADGKGANALGSIALKLKGIRNKGMKNPGFRDGVSFKAILKGGSNWSDYWAPVTVLGFPSDHPPTGNKLETGYVVDLTINGRIYRAVVNGYFTYLKAGKGGRFKNSKRR